MRGNRGFLIVAEAASSALGFLAAARLATRLGVDGFGSLDFSLGLVAWWLILVRGGFDAVVVRESARRPRRLDRFGVILIAGRLFSATAAWLMTAVLGGFGLTSAICGLMLFASAIGPDLPARVNGDTHRIAGASLARGIALAMGAWAAGASLRAAALAFVAAEVVSALAYGLGEPRRMRSLGGQRLVRVTLLYLRRSAAATFARFARVTLYVFDLCLLGLLHAPDLGTYAAARRVMFAILGALVVVPASALGPMAVEFRAEGRGGRILAGSLSQILILSLPAAVGLWFTADDWVLLMFGPSYAEAGAWLRLAAVRLPILALSATFQTALTASGRDGLAARTASLQCAAAAGAAWLGWSTAGTMGLAIGVSITEALGLVALAGLVGIPRRVATHRGLLGLSLLSIFCMFTPSLFAPIRSLLGAGLYVAPFLIGRRARSMPRPHFGARAIEEARRG